MIPVVYEANATNFFNQGLGVLSEGRDAKVTEARNGEFTLSMEYSIDGELFSELQNERIIKADAGHELKNQRFIIKRISKPIKGYVKIYAEHVSYKANEIPLLPHVNVSGSAQQALQQWQNNFIGDYKPFTVSSNITTQNSTSWSLKDVQNARQALGGVRGSILDVWGGEYKFDNLHISLFRERGVKANAMIAYGRNLIDFEQEESIMNTYTSIYPYALWRDDEGEEHLITANGYIVDSEHVNNYPNKKVLPVDFTIDFGVDEKPTSARLIQLAQSYITNNDIGIPNVSIRLTHLDLTQTLDHKEYEGIEKINLCDNVMVKFLKLGVDVTAKVVRTVWNVNLRRYDEIEIGAIRTSLSDRLSTIDKQVKEVRKEAEDARNVSLVAANGVNMIFYGPDEPTATKIGDTWFEEDGEYTIMRSWDGVIWRVIHDPRITDENKRAIEEAQSDLEDYKADIDSTLDTISLDIDDKFTSLTDITNDIQTLANTAQINAQTAIDNSINAMTDAQAALSSIDGVESLVQTISLDIDEINGTLDFKADRQELNAVTGIVDQHTLDIQANAAGLLVKAEQSTVDTLASTVSSLGTEVDIVAGQVSSKVWMADIDDIQVGGRNYLLNSKELTTAGSNGSGISRRINEDGHLEITAQPGNGNFASNLGLNASGQNVLNNIQIGEDFVFSVEIKSTDAGPRPPNIYISPSLSYRVMVGSVSTEFSRVYMTRKWLGTAWSPHLGFEQVSGTYIFRRPKLEKGTKPTDWTPAPEDTDAKIELVETEWKQTAQGFDQSILQINTNLDGKASLSAFNTLSSTVDGTIQRIGTAEGRINSVESTADGTHQIVSGPDGLTTQVSTLANGFNVLSQNAIQNLVPNPRFENGMSSWGIGNDVIVSNPTGGGHAFRNSTARTTPNARSRIWVTGLIATPGNTYTIKITYNGGSFNGRMFVGNTPSSVSDMPELPVTGNTIQTRTVSFSPTGSGGGTLSIFFMDAGDYRIHEIVVYESGGASQAQLSVLNDNINLRVAKGDVLSQINLEADRTLIQTGKLYLDADSVVFSGSAFIPNAAIESLSADKLTAGTIDFNTITGININASEIVGRNTSFVQSSWNNINNQIDVGDPGITISGWGNARSNVITSTGIDFFDAGTPAGYIGYFSSNASGAVERMQINRGANQRHSIGVTARSTHDVVLGYQGSDNTTFNPAVIVSGGNGTTTIYEQLTLGGRGTFPLSSSNNMILSATNYLLFQSINGTTRMNIQSNVNMLTTLNLNSNPITGASNVTLSGRLVLSGRGVLDDSASGNMIMNSSNFIVFQTISGTTRMDIQANVNLRTGLNLNGNDIHEGSDRRLKQIHGVRTVDDLYIIKNIEYVDFDYIDGAKGRRGFIAQQVQNIDGSLITVNPDDGMLGFDLQNYVHTIGHAVQQLAKEHDNTLLVASHAYILAEQHDDEITQLKQKVKELERKLEEAA